MQDLNDQLIVELFKKYLGPDETKLYYVYGKHESPGWMQALCILLGWLIISVFSTKHYLIGVTNKRLLLLEVSSSYEDKGVLPIEPRDLAEAWVKDSSKEKTIHFTLTGGRSYTIKAKKNLPKVENQAQGLEKIERFFRNFTVD